jgi:maltooligosyltrehalose trehalohydrolase
MLFQGQEFCASSPFLYFADHNPELAAMVERGRLDFLSQFESIANCVSKSALQSPHDPSTFERCRLDHSERDRNFQATALHRDLLTLRREDPVLREQRSDWMHGAVLGNETFVLRFLGGNRGDRLLVINFGKDLVLSPAPEPLLAPPREARWSELWSSEDPRYGGCARPPVDEEGRWTIAAESAVVLTT